MQTNQKKYKRIPWVCLGFGIGVSVSVIVCFGISALLFIIDKFRLPEQELIIFSSLFYGIVFFIALGGMRAETHRYKLIVSKKPFEELSPPPAKSKMTIDRIKTILWVIFSIFSLGWLTPALVIYWAVPIHPTRVISGCAWLFSLIAGAAYIFKKNSDIETPYHHFIFFVGICLGIVLVNSFSIGIWH